jgi:hypothetical protein
MTKQQYSGYFWQSQRTASASSNSSRDPGVRHCEFSASPGTRGTSSAGDDVFLGTPYFYPKTSFVKPPAGFFLPLPPCFPQSDS